MAKYNTKNSIILLRFAVLTFITIFGIPLLKKLTKHFPLK